MPYGRASRRPSFSRLSDSPYGATACRAGAIPMPTLPEIDRIGYLVRRRYPDHTESGSSGIGERQHPTRSEKRQVEYYRQSLEEMDPKALTKLYKETRAKKRKSAERARRPQGRSANRLPTPTSLIGRPFDLGRSMRRRRFRSARIPMSPVKRRSSRLPEFPSSQQPTQSGASFSQEACFPAKRRTPSASPRSQSGLRPFR